MASSTATGVFRVIQRVEALLLSYGILLIAGLTIVNVFTRTLFGVSLAFAEELSQFFIILVTFVGLSYAASHGRHIRMTAIYDQIGQRAQKALMLVITGATSLLMFALAYFAVHYVGTVKALGTVSPALQVPLWVVYLSAPLGLVLAGIQYAMAFLKNVQERDVYLSFQQKDEYDDPTEAAL